MQEVVKEPEMLWIVVFVVVVAPLATVLVFWVVGERGRPLRSSTWKFMREAGLRRFLNLRSLHAYVYGRWTKEYINLLRNHIFPRLGLRGRRWLADHYHAKVLTQEQAEAIISNDQEILLQDLEQIIPYPMARDLVLKGSPDVAVFQCGCRQVRDNPCQPIQVCMVVGQPFVDFILEHHPKSSRRLTQAEALELLQAEHERGHLHTAWFKDACIDRFYAICNCCKCCCGGIEAMTKYGIPMLASSGYVAQVDEALCGTCSICADACPFEAISVGDTAKVNREACMGCGVCVGKCPNEAISLMRDENKGLPLDVRLLSQEHV